MILKRASDIALHAIPHGMMGGNSFDAQLPVNTEISPDVEQSMLYKCILDWYISTTTER